MSALTTWTQFAITIAAAVVVTALYSKYYHLKQTRRHLRFLIRPPLLSGYGDDADTQVKRIRVEIRNDGPAPVTSMRPMYAKMPGDWQAVRVDVIATAPSGLVAGTNLGDGGMTVGIDVPVLNPGDRVVVLAQGDRAFPHDAQLTLHVASEGVAPVIHGELLSELDEVRSLREDKEVRRFLVFAYVMIAWSLIFDLVMERVDPGSYPQSGISRWLVLARYAVSVLIIIQGFMHLARWKWEQGVSSNPGRLRVPPES